MYTCLDVGSLSTAHMRPENQDLCFQLSFQQDPAPDTALMVLGVLDGVSQCNGRAASQAACRSMRPILSELVGSGDQLLDMAQEIRDKYILRMLRSAILEADHALSTSLPGSGTTISLAAVFTHEHGACLYTANVGDSPIYLLRLNTDNNYILQPVFQCQNQAGYLVEQQQISKEEALQAPEKNMLLHMAGTAFGYQLDPDNIHLHMEPLSQECFLFLGSDGALSVFPEEKMQDFFSNLQNQSIRYIAEELYDEVEQNSTSTDNFTLIGAHIITD